MHNALQQFLGPIARWFEQELGLPTPPQAQGWPRIAAGESVLIVAPTGSGKTLAAFLAAIDRLARDMLEGEGGEGAGVQILYISPLKSLANDVQRNVLRPLEQIAAVARREEVFWPEIRVAVRTGDTPQKERAAMLRVPPQLLITTPESLHLMLTSAARRMLRGVRYVIVDEVHALAGNKRGVFLSLLLERLEHERQAGVPMGGREKVAPGVYLNAKPPPPLVRIGLSATARPTDRLARWLAGWQVGEDGRSEPRPIHVIDTGQRKRLDLEVLCPWSSAAEEPAGERSHWPAIVRLVLELIRDHRSTLVFANSRRLVERIVGLLQEQLALEEASGDQSTSPVIQPHHGSISKEVRLATEESLKAGELDAVVATSSLELGIDIGALDLVCQIESPGSVAAALQRVGRAGHLEKATAKGRMIPKVAGELPQLAALIGLMLQGQVEETLVPENCLDVLAQQIVAATAVETCPRKALFRLLMQSDNYRRLPESQFDAVVEMLAARGAGLEASVLGRTSAVARPRISFDRVNDRLLALPGSAHLALTNGGVIADTGQFAVYLADSRVRLGELDEEFVFESREGDRIVLGSQVWRIERIDDDRVIVAPAEQGGASRMPFWRGETAPRSALLGEAIGALSRTVEQRVQDGENTEALRAWLGKECRLDDAAAEEFIDLYARQVAFGSAVPTDHRIVIEHFRDRTGEPLIAILTPLGSRVHHALRLALEARFADRRIPAQFLHNDDGILIRPAGEAAVLPENPLALLAPDELEMLVVDQLEQSALFGLRFRQNAARALMLPRMDPKRRTPLWQQRLRARNLLAVVKQHRNFPIVVETYRECLQDVLQVEAARKLLSGMAAGEVEVAVCRTTAPSPLVRSLWMNYEATFLYQWDEPLPTDQAGPTVDAAVLDTILQRKLEPSARRAPGWSEQDVAVLQRRISGMDYPARTPEELLEKIAAAGPLAFGPPEDPQWRTWTTDDPRPMLETLQSSGRLLAVAWPDAAQIEPDRPKRWIATEILGLLLAALIQRPPLFRWHNGRWESVPYDSIPPALLTCLLSPMEARKSLVEGELHRNVLMSVCELQLKYPFMRDAITGLIASLHNSGAVQAIPAADASKDDRFALAEHVDQLHALSLRRQRRAVATVDLTSLQRHLLAWHHVDEPLHGIDGLEDVLDALSPLAFQLDAWERDVLPLRVRGFNAALLEQACLSGHWVWVGYAPDAIAFIPRHLLPRRPAQPTIALPAQAQRIQEYLRERGASYLLDIELDLIQSTPEALAALRDLAFAGLVSNDRLESLRALLATDVTPTAPRTLVESARYPTSFRRSGRPDRRSARLARLKAGSGRPADHTSLGGRWFLLPPTVVPIDPLALAESAADRVERFLRRHGFACRELLDPQADGPWRGCYDVLTRLEWAGTVRRGYFVDQIAGSQFALPEVRLTPSPAIPPDGSSCLWLAMRDPANLFAHLPGPLVGSDGSPQRISRTAGTWLAISAGRPIMAALSWASALLPLTSDHTLLEAALRTLPILLERLPPNRPHHLQIRRWGEADILGSPAEPILRSVGFMRDTQGLRLYRAYPEAAPQDIAEPPGLE